MTPTNRSTDAVGFQIDSFGNGLCYEIVRQADGETVFLQGDDATRLHKEFERVRGMHTDEDVVTQYFA